MKALLLFGVATSVALCNSQKYKPEPQPVPEGEYPPPPSFFMGKEASEAMACFAPCNIAFQNEMKRETGSSDVNVLSAAGQGGLPQFNRTWIIGFCNAKKGFFKCSENCPASFMKQSAIAMIKSMRVLCTTEFEEHIPCYNRAIGKNLPCQMKCLTKYSDDTKPHDERSYHYDAGPPSYETLCSQMECNKNCSIPAIESDCGTSGSKPIRVLFGDMAAHTIGALEGFANMADLFQSAQRNIGPPGFEPATNSMPVNSANEHIPDVCNRLTRDANEARKGLKSPAYAEPSAYPESESEPEPEPVPEGELPPPPVPARRPPPVAEPGIVVEPELKGEGIDDRHYYHIHPESEPHPEVKAEEIRLGLEKEAEPEVVGEGHSSATTLSALFILITFIQITLWVM